MMDKKLLASLLYAFEVPLGVWSGIELDHKHYVMGCILLGAIMLLIVFGCKYFIEAQAEEIKK
jgi:hypothetical protein